MQPKINTSFKSSKPGAAISAPKQYEEVDFLELWDWDSLKNESSPDTHIGEADDNKERINDRPAKRLKTNQDFTDTLASVHHGLDQDQTTTADTIGSSTTFDATIPSTYRGFEVLQSRNAFALSANLFLSPVRNQSRRPGIIYLYTRSSDPDHVKLGSTYSSSITRRNREIRSHCKYEPQFKAIIENVMFAGRVEMLIHRELEYMGLRRREVVCRYGSGIGHNKEPPQEKKELEDRVYRGVEIPEQPSQHDQEDETSTTPVSDFRPAANPSTPKFCRGNHREWFFLPVSGDYGAATLLESWTSFFATVQPYSLDTGILKPEWVTKVTALAVRDRLLSVNVLWAMWAEIQFGTAVKTSGVGTRVEGAIEWTKERRRLWREYLKTTEKQGEVAFDHDAVGGTIMSISGGNGGHANDGLDGVCESNFCLYCGSADHEASLCAVETVCTADRMAA